MHTSRTHVAHSSTTTTTSVELSSINGLTTRPQAQTNTTQATLGETAFTTLRNFVQKEGGTDLPVSQSSKEPQAQHQHRYCSIQKVRTLDLRGHHCNKRAVYFTMNDNRESHFFTSVLTGKCCSSLRWSKIFGHGLFIL